MNNHTHQKIAETIWLNYFNNIALERGIIDEQEWRNMHWIIERQEYSRFETEITES